MDNSLLFDADEVYSNAFLIKDRHFISPLILSTVIVLSLIGNILVVVISVRCMRLRSLTSIFILNLALSDLLFTAELPLSAYVLYWRLSFEDGACKVLNLVFSTGFYSSIVLLVLMSFQHYMAIVHPHSAWKKGRLVTHVLICVWIMSVLAALPAVMHTEAHLYPGTCVYSSRTALLATTYKENFIFVSGFLFMAFCYIRILQTSFTSPKNPRHRAIGLTFLLVAMFFICWAPYNAVRFLHTIPYYSIKFSTQFLKHLSYTGYICHILAFTRCCLNPVIYGLYALIFHKTV